MKIVVKACLVLSLFSCAIHAMEEKLHGKKNKVVSFEEPAEPAMSGSVDVKKYLEAINQLAVFRKYVREMNPEYVLESGAFNEDFYQEQKVRREELKKKVETVTKESQDFRKEIALLLIAKDT